MIDTDLPVYLIDDEVAVRRSVGFMLRTGGYRVESFESGEAFLKVVGDLPKGCILLDVRMPGMDGLEVQTALRTRGITMPVIIFTGHGDISVAVRAMKAGAIEFIEKPFEKAVLTEALSQAQRLISVADRAVERADQARIRLNVLTPRETDVLGGLVEGHSNKAIAFDLGISPRTVEIHRANLMSKLEVKSLSDALRIAFAARMGADIL